MNGVSSTLLWEPHYGIKMLQNLVFLFLLPFVIYLNEFDLLSWSIIFRIHMMDSLVVLNFGTL